MRWMLISLGCLSIMIIGLPPETARAVTDYVNDLPNGAVFGCGNCHSPTTPFYSDFRDNGYAWDANLATIDSDGDGFSNGKELQDPDGLWRPGEPAPGDPDRVSNPGQASSQPPQTPTPPPGTPLPSPTPTPTADVTPPVAGDYALIAWNDLGMHCMNPFYEHLCVLPPFNTLWAQVIQRGSPGISPQLVQSGATIDYSFQRNTYSTGKTDFWDFEDQLFGVSLPDNIGLTGKGMTGSLDVHAFGWWADGIPLTPYEDDDWNTMVPYQLADLELRGFGGELLDATTIVGPVSIEMHCDNCHQGPQGPEVAILALHDEEENTNLLENQPVLCANCHEDHALEMPGVPGVPSFSLAMHGTHAEEYPSLECYNCHPGTETQCLRGVHDTMGMTCQSCHGSISQVAQSIRDGREPWLEQPSCGECHGSTYAPEPGTLYRNSRGHGGVYCEACHGSPHAIYPSREPRDNLQSIRLQGHAGKIDDCSVCHGYIPAAPGPHGYNPPTWTPVPTGTPGPNPSPTPTPFCTMVGDIDYDERITTGDALIAFRIALELYSPTPDEQCRADADLSGGVTTADALCIFQEALALPNDCF